MRERLVNYRDPGLKILKENHEKKKRFFLHRSVSMEWFSRLILLRACPLRVGLVLRLKMILEGSDTITLTTSGLSRFGISRQQKWKGLKALKDEPLIRIDSRPGKNPGVTIIHPPADEGGPMKEKEALNEEDFMRIDNACRGIFLKGLLERLVDSLERSKRTEVLVHTIDEAAAL